MRSQKKMFKFLNYLKPYWFQELVTLLCIILTSVGLLSSPYILKIIIDDILPSGNYELLTLILFLLLAINILRIGLSMFSGYLYEWISNKIMLDLRMELYSHLIRLPMAFFQENNTGDIVYRVNNEVGNVQNILTGSLLRFTQSIILIIGIAVVLVFLNWKLFLFSIVVIPITYSSVLFFHPKIVKYTEIIRARESRLLGLFMDKFDHIKIIKSFGHYNFEIKNLTLKINELINANLKHQLTASSSQAISTFFVSLSPLIVLFIGGGQVMHGAMTLGTLIAFIQYLNRIFNPFGELMSLYTDITRASVSMKRLLAYFEIEKEVSGEVIPNLNKTNHCISFNNISFSRNDNKVLKDIDLQLELGKKYALVGPSGCGKSTLVDLICRFVKPDHGQIKIGGVDLNKIDIAWLREHIALVSQSDQMFQETIWENIHYGNLKRTASDIEETAMLMGIRDEIEEMPDKYNSLIGGNGTRLSGGQVQRLALTRILLKKSDILILDEATSAIDSNSERTIIENLFSVYQNKTSIIISHRLSTLKFVDEIICMDNGRIIDKGRYDELLCRCEIFKTLYLNQMTKNDMATTPII